MFQNIFTKGLLHRAPWMSMTRPLRGAPGTTENRPTKWRMNEVYHGFYMVLLWFYMVLYGFTMV